MDCQLHLHTVAFHFDAGYEFTVPGVGALCDTKRPDLRAMVGLYSNSIAKRSHYAGFTWQPFRVGPARIGAAFGMVDGYRRYTHGYLTGALTFKVSERGEMHLTVVPYVPGLVAPAIGVSYSIRF